MGLSVLGYRSHLLQPYNPACGHKESSHLYPVLAYDFLSRCKFSTLTHRQLIISLTHVLTLSVTEASIKDLILSRIELTTPHYY